MPLPPILAAKLAKRGLFTACIEKPEDSKPDHLGVTGCPNKNNFYHDCNSWCESHWKPVSSPDAKYTRRVGKLTQKYPLPHNWTEVFDKGVKRYYYWDLEKDLVSWLPPKHPKSVSTESAASLREKRIKGVLREERIVYRVHDDQKKSRKRSSRSSRRDHRDKGGDSDKRHKHDDKDFKKRSRHDNIDPMDPASYSDIPIGTWSDGLESNKSGVDSTATGAPYQQRPYPSPGDILSANKSKSKRGN